jgi:hypothetical protein
MAPEQDAHQHEHQHGRAHTCCDVTGKCNMKVSSGAPSLAPTQLVTTLPVTAGAIAPYTDILDPHSVSTLAHGPPTYLRNVTLRI